MPYMALAPKGSVKVYLVSSVIHFNVITVDIDMLISIVKHCSCEWQGNEMIEFLYNYVKPLKSQTILIQTKENCPKFLCLRILQSLFKLKNIVQLCQ